MNPEDLERKIEKFLSLYLQHECMTFRDKRFSIDVFKFETKLKEILDKMTIGMLTEEDLTYSKRKPHVTERNAFSEFVNNEMEWEDDT